MPDMIFFFPPRSRGWTSTCSRRRHRLPPEEQKEVPTRSHHQKLSRRWDPPPNSNRYINTYIPFLKKALSAFEDGCNFVFATITRAVRNCNFIRHKKKTFFVPILLQNGSRSAPSPKIKKRSRSVSMAREKLKEERESIVLWRKPLTTVHYSVRELLITVVEWIQK